MRFVCLVYLNEATLDALPADEMRKLDEDSLAYDETLQKSGHMIVAHALRSTSEALYLRSRGGKVVTMDGPHAETKEQLMGFILIEARDLDDAIAVASKVPCAAYGTIELRAVAYIEGETPAS
ncbi:YciI family protein [Nitratireductor sp. ZSWI3]|uniref:YciI family protein n=1 Tax=Nitratireductor sp. ZSWI3 TaxID=2966359 RepID=UPI0021504F02|nr:YciI family protein [Nitratireductor sp. ZSWI3]MCR4269089.1 YciI family protein [Nitratireductor sp. ZSWI3]